MCTALGCARARHPANPSEIPVMVLGKLPSPRSSADKSPRRKVHRVGVLVAVLALTACSPVETWRDWTGASENDPDPETARNTQNLAAGEAADYPNLASVPPPPNRALTTAEREKLSQNLIADRIAEILVRGASPNASSGSSFIPSNVVTRCCRSNTSWATECARL